MTDESSAKGQPFEVVSVRRAVPPPGGKGSNGYRYVIAFEGTNIIHGCRQGNLKAVTEARFRCQADACYADNTLRSALVTRKAQRTGDEGRNGRYHAAPGLIFQVTQ